MTRIPASLRPPRLPLMKSAFTATLITLCFTSCNSYHPLKDPLTTYKGPFIARSAPGVKATFLGNTTIHLTDGTTDLLVDGFLSRPSILNTFFGLIKPKPEEIAEQFKLAGISKVDGLLIGHAHHDHALDAPAIAEKEKCLVMGNTSYRKIHEGHHLPADKSHLFTVPCDGTKKEFGKFTVSFVKSEHVTARKFVQKWVEGEVCTPFKTPAYFSRFKCGDVYAIHIEHPEGSILITTTAGAVPGALDRYRADVVFLGIGLLAKETCCQQKTYWHETVEAVKPHTVIPVHWDNFSRKLSRTPGASTSLSPTPSPPDDVQGAMQVVNTQAKEHRRGVMLMGLRDSFLLHNGKVHTQQVGIR